jgi:hypothetical protein
MDLWDKNILYSTLSSISCMVDFLSREPEEQKIRLYKIAPVSAKTNEW